jgi:hypothetical protein
LWGDVLDVINKKFENFEKSIHGMKVEIDQIKAKQNEHRRILAVEEEHHHNIEDQVRKLNGESGEDWGCFCILSHI